MKMLNLKSFPILCCFFLLNTPKSSVLAETSTNSKTSARFPRTKVTPNVGTQKKVEHTADNKKSIESKDEFTNQNKTKFEGNKKEGIKPAMKKNVSVPTTKKVDGVKRAEDKKTTDKTEKSTEPKKVEEKKKVDEIKKVSAESNTKSNKGDNKSMQLTTTDKVQEEKDKKVMTVEDKKEADEEKKNEARNSRRSRRTRRNVIAEKEQEKVAKRGSSRQKSKIEDKKNKNSDLDVDVDVDDKKESKSKDEYISKDEYLSGLKKRLDDYTGKMPNEFDAKSIIEQMNNKEKEVYQSRYFTSYDVNGNPNIKKNDVQFWRTLVRRIDLKEKINEPYFYPTQEITKFLLEGIRDGKLEAFSNEFLTEKMTPERLREQMLMPKDVEAIDSSDTDIQELYFDYHDVSIIDLHSNWIFDKNSSDFSEDVYLLKLIIPKDKFADTTKIERCVCCIRFNDAIAYLKKLGDLARVQNRNNKALVLNMGEAFVMKWRLRSFITSMSGVDVNDMFGGKDHDSSWGANQAETFMNKFEAKFDVI